jgi:lysophospholipase L1-like esterase
MPSPERIRTWSNLSRLRAGAVIVTLIAVAAIVTSASLADLVPGAPGADVPIKATSTPSPVTSASLDSKGANKGVDRPVTVVGVGDSVTAGTNCSCASFVGLYAAKLASRRGLRTTSVNSGMGGWTSSALLESLTRPGMFRDQVAKADILLVTIGANDLSPLESERFSGRGATCYSSLVQRVGHNVELIVDAARAAKPDHPPTILVTGYWNVFKDGDVAKRSDSESFRHWSDTLTRAENTQICEGAERAGATCVDIYTAFKGDGSKDPTLLLAEDGDHPDAAGHELIAATLLASTPEPIP